MKWTEKQRRIAEVILAHRTDTEHGFDFKVVMEALSSEEPVSKSQISDVGRELRTKNWELVEEQGEQTPGGAVETGNQTLSETEQQVKRIYRTASYPYRRYLPMPLSQGRPCPICGVTVLH